MDEPLNLVLFSGTDDKLQAAAVLTAGAAALGKPVNVFLQYWALDAFRADRIDADHGLAPEAGADGRARSTRCAPRARPAGPTPCARPRSWGASTSRPARCPWTCSSSSRRPRPARRRRRGRDRLLPGRRRAARSSSSEAEAAKGAPHDHAQTTHRSTPAGCPARCRSSRRPRPSRRSRRASSSRSSRPTPGRSRTSRPGPASTGHELVEQRVTAASTASSSVESEATAMMTAHQRPMHSTDIDPSMWRSPTRSSRPSRDRRSTRRQTQRSTTKELVIVNWSGELDASWPTLILAIDGRRERPPTTRSSSRSGASCRSSRTRSASPARTGCRRCCRSCSGPGIDHLKLSKMNFLGMGPWMIGRLAQAVRRRQPARAARGGPGDGRGVHPLPDDDGHVRP